MTADGSACVAFLQRLVRCRALPGREGDLADLVETELRALGYPEVRRDAVGNVIARIAGRGAAPPVVFNTHLDHVDVGRESDWAAPPYGGVERNGRIWGRGAVDIKGPLAAQVHGVARLVGSEPPAGDVYVTAVVQEEIGGVGARHLARHLFERAPARVVAVVGEPSRNTLRRGHRGRVQLELGLVGRSAHASTPQLGVNPLFALGHLLAGLDRVPAGDGGALGPSTAVPTLLRTDQSSPNVVPGEVWLTIDWRTVPGQEAGTCIDALRPLVEEAARRGAVRGVVEVPVYRRTTYTGVAIEIPADNFAYLLDPDDPALRAAETLLGHDPAATSVWSFATDGGHFARAGWTPVGIGPGDPELAHTNSEHIEISELLAAVEINATLAAGLGERVATGRGA